MFLHTGVAISVSTNRINPQAGYVYGKRDGLCRWCKKPVLKRRTFCSDECVHQWKIRSDPGYARNLVYKRDHGICAICGVDTQALRAKIASMKWGWNDAFWKWSWITYRRVVCGSIWDMDHIIPVVEGGGECGLENLRTLCIPCHRQVTADLRKRMTGKKKPAVDIASAGEVST
jgi:5-methylcytosine-specific restriction enzyme A